MAIHESAARERLETYNGLSGREAGIRLKEHGLNTLSEKKKISVLKILFSQFTDFMVILLLASTVVSMFMGEVTEAVTIIAIVALNAVLGFIQEFRTEKTMEALKELAAPCAKVIRDKVICAIPAEEIVQGDLMILEQGDRVPADACLIEAYGMRVDESLLTGESEPVEKHADYKGASNIDAKSSVFMGTIVSTGRGKAIVHATGMRTEMGNIADMIQGIDEEETPLQKKLEHLGKIIAYGCIAICAVVTLTGVLRGESLFSMLLAGISLAVAAVPEGLPAIVTIALALGVRRMLKRKALVRKLPAVETLGCASVICSDKTGTLTENRMTVRKLFTDGKHIDVTGKGLSQDGEFIQDGRSLDSHKSDSLKLLLEICTLCNNSSMKVHESKIDKVKKLFTNSGEVTVDGDPTEAALLIAALKGGITYESLERSYKRVEEIPFDSDRKMMSVICRKSGGEMYVFSKGAPDIMLERCTKLHTERGIVELSQLEKNRILKENDKMGQNALRVIAVAYKKLGSQGARKENAEDGLVFAGLAGMIDPPRKEALEAVAKCRMAGIKTVMITGDHKVTAKAVAKEIGIYDEGDGVLTGAELDRMDERKLESIAGDVSVYARVSPKHKLMIVKALRKLGHIVAMTGDGVNDAPAVKEADIGVSMGISGTDVTKEASSMILMDDNFATIVAAIEEGRVIYNNIRKFIRYMLSCNLGEVLTMFLGMLLGLPVPLLPIQILWVNLATDGLPAIALGFDPPEKDIMMRTPRGANESIFSRGLMGLIVTRGVLIGFSTLMVFASILYFTADIEKARTGAFVTLVMTQLIHVFECKSEKKNIFEIPLFNNMWLVAAVLCSLAMMAGVVYIEPLQVVFKTCPLAMPEWTIVAGFSALGPLAASFIKRKK